MLFAVIFCGPLLTLPMAHALTMRVLPATELLARADSVVVGQITEATPGEWTDPAAGQTYPMVRYTFAIAEVVKGTLKPWTAIHFEQTDAALPRRGSPLLRTAPYVKGSEYLLFLQSAKDGSWRVVGMEQGKFTITPSAGGQKVLQNGIGNRGLFGTGGNATFGGKGLTKGESQMLQQSSGTLPYEEFLSLMRKLGS